ncbi:MAG: hypothetical protein A2X01_19915 [Bacteroidetes bacterium GWF2_35_48]|nr:MAG: hypothetical protein A2X01_19915 [Bacteroidetes bacterium GWF2_35_48]
MKISRIIILPIVKFIIFVKLLLSLFPKKMQKFFTVIIIFICAQFNYYGQEPKLIQYTPENGLPSYETYCVFQDSKGFIWIGTDAGVSRFDGNEFENFTTSDGLTDNTVFNIYEDKKGRIWFCTFNCKLCYFYNEKIYPYRYNNQIISIAYNKFIKSIFIDNNETLYISFFRRTPFSIDKYGNISYMLPAKLPLYRNFFLIEMQDFFFSGLFGELFSNEWSIYFFNKRQLIVPQAIPQCNKFYIPRINVIKNSENEYFIFIDNNLYYFLNNKISFIPKKTKFGKIVSVFKDKNNIIWLATEKGVFYYPNTDIFNAEPLLFTSIPASSILIDFDNNIWITTLNKGIFLCNSFGIYSYLPGKGLLLDDITDITQFNDSILLLQTNDNYFFSLYKYALKKNAINYTQSNLFHRPLLIFKTPNNKLLNIGYKGDKVFLHTYKNEFLVNTFFFEGHPKVMCLRKSDSTVYIAHHNGIFHVSESKITNLTKKFKLFRTTTVYEDSKSILWIGRRNGLWYYNQKEFYKYVHKKFLNLFLYNITDIKEYNNLLWIATRDEGIIAFNEDSVIYINKRKGLSSDQCNTLFFDADTLWAGTNNGLNKIIFSKEKKYSIEKYCTSSGLLSAQIQKIIKIKAYLYLNTPTGINAIHSSCITPKFRDRKLSINYIKVNDKSLPEKKIYELDNNENKIQLKISYPTFNNFEKQKFRYKYDTSNASQWFETESRIINIQLLPGHNVFTIQAINPVTEQPEATKSISFIISKPYWQKVWFIVLIVCFSILLSFFYVLYYRNKIKRKAEIRSMIAEAEIKALRSRMNPHFLFNALSSIQRFILSQNTSEADKYFSKFTKLIRLMLDTSERGTITLEAEIEILNNYIEIEQLRLNNKFSFNILIKGENIQKNKIEIPSMMVQPLVENAIWHGLSKKTGQGHLSITFQIKNKILAISVEDNGVGRDKAMEIKERNKTGKKSLSLDILQKRLQIFNDVTKMKNKIIFVDLFDEHKNPSGTKVTVLTYYKFYPNNE